LMMPLVLSPSIAAHCSSLVTKPRATLRHRQAHDAANEDVALPGHRVLLLR
jgi:hypothetical protein